MGPGMTSMEGLAVLSIWPQYGENDQKRSPHLAAAQGLQWAFFLGNVRS